MQAAIDDARIAEMSILEAIGDNAQIADQLTEMRKDISRMAQRYDSLALSAPVQQARDRSTSPARRVSFSEPAADERRSARAQGGTNYTPFNRGGYRGPRQFRSRYNGRARESRSNFMPHGTFRPNPMTSVPYMLGNEYQMEPQPCWNTVRFF